MDNVEIAYQNAAEAVKFMIDKFYESGFDPCLPYFEIYEQELNKIINGK